VRPNPPIALALGVDSSAPRLIEQARRYERDALVALLGPSLRPLHTLCTALAGSPEAGTALAERALGRCLDSLPSFRGDEAALRAWVLGEAAAAGARRRPAVGGLREALARLPRLEYRLVTLRILAGMSTEEVAMLLRGRPQALRAQLVHALRWLDGRADRNGAGPAVDLEAFDEAVTRVLGGARPQEAAARVPAPADVMALLRTVAALRSLGGSAETSEGAAGLRSSLLTGATERRVRWVQQHRTGPVVPGMAGRRYPRRRLAALALGLALLCPVLLGAALALVAAFSDPDAPLYGVKRATEAVLVAVNGDPVGRAGLELNLAETRQREAEDMAVRGQGELAVRAELDRLNLLEAAARDLSRAPRTPAWSATRSRLLGAFAAPLDPVERDLEAAGRGDAAARVRALGAVYQSDRKAVQRRLG
jgi:DNA-directed RNA polymerase specialized sigma24 family protein